MLLGSFCVFKESVKLDSKGLASLRETILFGALSSALRVDPKKKFLKVRGTYFLVYCIFNFISLKYEAK